MARPSVEQLIEHFQLKQLPVEGGVYRQTYRSPLTLPREGLAAPYQMDKPAGTAIMLLLTAEPDSFSALHRLPTDEIYHFYLGDPVTLLLLYPDGPTARVRLGQDVLNSEQVQFTVPAGVWQGSLLADGGEYALLGTTMAPGFTHSDYEGGDREKLRTQYPSEADLITRLTRLTTPLDMPPEDD